MFGDRATRPRLLVSVVYENHAWMLCVVSYTKVKSYNELLCSFLGHFSNVNVVGQSS